MEGKQTSMQERELEWENEHVKKEIVAEATN